MNKIFNTFKFYALSLVASTGIFFAFALENWFPIDHDNVFNAKQVVLALKAIGSVSVVIFVTFGSLGLLLELLQYQQEKKKRLEAESVGGGQIRKQ